jgi:hypothetical protein
MEFIQRRNRAVISLTGERKEEGIRHGNARHCINGRALADRTIAKYCDFENEWLIGEPIDGDQ